MIKHLKTLISSLHKQGFHKEAFKVVNLYIQASYDSSWRDHVERMTSCKEFPFSSWFPPGKNRVYLDFKRADIDVPSEVESALEDLGWTIDDYLNGYAINKSSKRKMKIGKVLSRKISNLKKELEGELEPEYRELCLDLLNEISEGLRIFQNDSQRNSADSLDLKIVISQNPHDVAQCSYDRNWESCFNLDEGMHSDSAFCEVKDGGLIAYLIKGDDSEIQNPLARVLIRRFISSDGTSFAKAENSIYGQEFDGFLETVNDWLATKNQKMLPGIYKRKGGDYSDSFGDERTMVVSPTSNQEIASWFNNDFKFNKNFTEWTIHDNHLKVLMHEIPEYEDRLNELLQEGIVGLDQMITYQTVTLGSAEEANAMKRALEASLDLQAYTSAMLIATGFDEEEVEDMDPDVFWNYHDQFSKVRFSIEEKSVDKTEQLKEDTFYTIMENSENLSRDVIMQLKKYVDEDRPNNRLTHKGFILYSKFPELLEDEVLANLDPFSTLNLLRFLPEEKKQIVLEGRRKYLEKELRLDSENMQAKIEDIKGRLPPGSETLKNDISRQIALNARRALYVNGNLLTPTEKSSLELIRNFFNELTSSDLLNEKDKSMVSKDVLGTIVNNIPTDADQDRANEITLFMLNLSMPYYDYARFDKGTFGIEGARRFFLDNKVIPGMEKFLPVFEKQLKNLSYYVNKYMKETTQHLSYSHLFNKYEGLLKQIILVLKELENSK